jgi:hypothetical protein
VIRLLSLVALALCLGGCETREIAALENERESLRAERDKLAAIAEHLDEYREEAEKLKADLARTVEMGSDLDHDKRVDRIAALPGLSRKPSMNGGAELSGTSFDSFALARRQGGSIAVERLAIDATGNWTLTVPAYDTGPYSAAYEPGVQLLPPTPAPGRFAGRRSLALRSEIEALRHEVAELKTLVGEVSGFEKKKRELTTRLEQISRPSRLNTVFVAAAILFQNEGAVCRSGSVTVSNENVRFWCAPRAADVDSAAEALRASFTDEEASGGWRLGPLSIDPSNPEPIQGSLLRKK